MPIIHSQFAPRNILFRNAQLSTIYASLLRYVPSVRFQRERLETVDGDFLDLDWARIGSKKLIITLAGLEGKSRSLYSRAAIHYFQKRGYDALGLNYRGCSGEPNQLLRGYHMGASDDVKLTVEHALTAHAYDEIVLIGFSLGGNLALKYLGEEGSNLPNQVKAAVTFSVPIDIKQSNERMNKWYNWHYLKYFMIPLNWKANRKKKQFPKELKDYQGFFMSGSFVYFDKHFTAPANGFSSVEDYWIASSCRPYLKDIKVPALIVSSTDDTFLSDRCFPKEAANQNQNLVLEISNRGGHCGFIRNFLEKEWWMEERAFEFVKSL
jgi:predicted alpha/beta-fold hydrolase